MTLIPTWFTRYLLREKSAVTGRIFARSLPADLAEEDFKLWWPRLTEREKDRYTVAMSKNIITLNGRSNFLIYVGNNALSGGIGGTVVPFAQYFSVGTGAIAVVSAGDTGMLTELARAVPGTATVSGNTVNISTFFSSGSANGTYTNAGLWGGAATGSLGTGTLMTHALYNYTKTNAASLTNDYLISIN